MAAREGGGGSFIAAYRHDTSIGRQSIFSPIRRISPRWREVKGEGGEDDREHTRAA